jgi:hypothetical protein
LGGTVAGVVRASADQNVIRCAPQEMERSDEERTG